MKKKFIKTLALLTATTLLLTPALQVLAATSAELLKTMSFTTTSKVYDSSAKKTVTQTIYHNNALKNRKLFKGLDVSWHQASNQTTSKIDWAKAHADGIDFTFVRVAARKGNKEGTLYEDTSANSHIQGALKNKINVGVYFFSQALTVSEAKAEAKYTLKVLDAHNWDITLPVVFDYEYYTRLTSGKLSKSTMTKICTAFCDVIEDAGYTPAIYANYSMFGNHLTTSTLAKKYTIWLARYKNTATSNTLSSSSSIPYADITYPYEFWQFTSSGRVSGYGGNLDCNYWYKDVNIKTQNLDADNSTTSSIDLSWDNAKDAKKYKIYRFNEESQSYKNIGDSSKTSFTDKDLSAGKDYKYKVRCYWTIGGTNYFGKYSDIITASTKPAKVADVSVDNRASTHVTLNWKKVSGASAYGIYQYNEKTNSFDKLDQIDAKETSYKVSNLKSASSYTFRVRAVRKSNGSTYYGSYSDKFSITTKPLKVSNLSVTSKTKKTATISFGKISKAEGYCIYRYDAANEKWTRIKTITDGTTSYKNTGLTSGKTYTYRVRAFITEDGARIYGLYSNQVKIKVK